MTPPTPHHPLKTLLNPILTLLTLTILSPTLAPTQTVWVSRFWHNHQPIYWPEWNTNGSQTNRVQYAWDSIVLKPTQTYPNSTAQHPENNLVEIFSNADRVAAYQGRPRDALQNINSAGGFAMSYSGSLIDNVRQLAAHNQLGYGPGWWDGNRQARGWSTPSGSPRLDLVGFTYHHSLGAVLPKSVFRKEIQLFKQAWWKAWNGNMDLSDHSKGFFPTEMAFTIPMIDVLVDEGYQWVIVASHHLSRTCPTYFDPSRINPPSKFDIKYSPPNKADLLGPSPTTGWWFGEPNPGQAAWNVSPFAYQLHRAKYVNPATGQEKSIILVPSDDVLSYRYGYANEGISKIQNHIAPFATDPNRPAIVLPATDGDNAWGGGYDSWMVATPQLFSNSQSAGYKITTIQDMVNQKPPPPGQFVHIEAGSWIFPEMCYGSPYFLKWIEPPLKSGSPTAYPNTIVDLETPGFALKFWSWAAVVTGANWVETAEQIWKGDGGTVEAWKIQAPYDWHGPYTNPNIVELAWHIYLKGLDSGFNYYGGLGNDDEVKPSLATLRAIQKLEPYINANLHKDQTPPTVFYPQRFPWNPGGWTFGWFNPVPGNSNYLKKMNSEFYIWTHVYDVSGVQSVNLKIRMDNDGVNTLANNQNETYAGGPDVGPWITIPMTKRTLPRTRAELNAAANNAQINYFIELPPGKLADYYYAKIHDGNVPNFRGKLFDYYIEATDTKGNIARTDIQHVFVEDDGNTPTIPATPTNLQSTTPSATQVNLTWNAVPGATQYEVKRNNVLVATVTTNSYNDTNLIPQTQYCYTVAAKNTAGTSPDSAPHCVTTPAAVPPPTPTGLTATAQNHTTVIITWTATPGAAHYTLRRNGNIIASNLTNTTFTDTGLSPLTTYSYTLQAHNIYGNSAQTAPVTVTTPSAPINFNMDGQFEHPNYLIADNGMRLYAAVRGTKLYVATWATGASPSSNDHFIYISDSLLSSATTPAVWAKAGQIAIPPNKPYLAGEGTNNYRAWFNAGTTHQSAEGTGPQALEGVIDLVEAFGQVPQNLYFAAVAYGNPDGAGIAAQVPAGNGNNNLEPNEWLHMPTVALRDENADFIFDRLDPERDFVIQHTITASGNLQLTFNTFPGRTYQVQHSLNLTTWTDIGTPITAGPGEITKTFTHTAAVNNHQRSFYRIRLNP
ncbi:MAG: hypothetical protein NZM04_04855 [Methylacidiphilales bacterium]|nr:hypothetical protein [Candidatus Methylacidiphilales bacterium]MDW8349716.1 hypothetical protein [Verrucomicrobiae bacterium]